MNLPVEVIEAVREDRCVVFLGNRVSLEAAELKDRAYPEQKALARQLGWRKPTAVVGKKGTIASVEEGAAAYERANGRAGLLALLERELGGLETPSPAHLAVVRRFPLVFTSNYDDLLERAGREAGVTVDVLGRQLGLEQGPAFRWALACWLVLPVLALAVMIGWRVKPPGGQSAAI